MKKAVIFDMYETLITLWNSKPYMGKELAEDIGIPESKFREIWDLTEDERTLEISPEDCLYCGDGGSKELEVAQRMNMLPVQALWYLKENSRQLVGRLSEFIGVQNPMEILEYF